MLFCFLFLFPSWSPSSLNSMGNSSLCTVGTKLRTECLGLPPFTSAFLLSFLLRCSLVWKWKSDSKMIFLNRSARVQSGIVWRSAQEEKMKLVIWWFINRVNRILFFPPNTISIMLTFGPKSLQTYLSQGDKKPVTAFHNFSFSFSFFYTHWEFFRYKGECLKSFGSVMQIPLYLELQKSSWNPCCLKYVWQPLAL